MECRVKDILVHYEAIGEGKPVVQLHGYFPDHRLMTGCMEPVFAKRSGYRRIYPDLPGMGKTPGADWIVNSDSMLEVMLEFIDRIIPGENFLLAGESYGGYLARGIVSRWPERVDGLFLLCPCIVADREKRDIPPFTVLKTDEELLARLDDKDAEEFAAMAVVQSEALWQRFRDEILSGCRIADEKRLNHLQNTGYAFSCDVDGPARPFGKPTLMLLGRQDASVGYKDAWRILDQYPRATFAVLDRAGHNLQIEQEEVFNCLVREWLDRVEESV